jgi:hypothetical protein
MGIWLLLVKKSLIVDLLSQWALIIGRRWRSTIRFVTKSGIQVLPLSARVVSVSHTAENTIVELKLCEETVGLNHSGMLLKLF